MQAQKFKSFITTAIFNEGYNAILKIMDRLNIVLGRKCHFCGELTTKSDSRVAA